EDPEGFVANLGAAEGRLRQSLFQRGMQEYVSKGLATQEQVNEAIDAAMYPITEAKKAILGGDFVYAGKLATINKIVQDRALNDLLASSPELQVGMGLSKVNVMLGKEYLDTKKTDIDTITQEVIGRIAMGQQMSIIEGVAKSGDQKVARATIDESLEAIKQEGVTGQDLSNFIDAYYGPDAFNLMDPNVVAPEDLLTLYTQMLDPAVVRAVAEKGTPEDIDKIMDFAIEKFRAIPEIRDAAGNLSGAVEALKAGQIEYDPEKNRIDIVYAADALRGTPLQGYQTRKLKKFVGSFNKALSVLTPLAEATGSDTTELVQEVVSDMVTMEKTPGQGLGSMIGQAIQQGIENLENAPKASDIVGGRTNAASLPEGEVTIGPVSIEDEPEEVTLGEEVPMPTEIDFVFSSPEIASELTTDPVYAP